MTLLDHLEKRFRRFGVPFLTEGLIAAQVLVYILLNAPMPANNRAFLIENLVLVPEKVLEGELWRLVTFLAMPPLTHVVFAFFFWYLFYLMGTALENYWGTFRYNVYLGIGYVAALAAAFAFPEESTANIFLYSSVFLAFAFLNPDFQLYIFFIIPVRIKWFALIQWIGLGYTLLVGDWPDKLLVLASILNFLVFFGKDVWFMARAGRRRMARQAQQWQPEPEFFHRCLVCKITDKTHPTMDFRYCSKCFGNCCYCQAHLHDHVHVQEPEK